MNHRHFLTALQIEWTGLPTSMLAAVSLLLLMLVPATAAWAGAVADRVQARSELRVCIWPQYYGVTMRDPRTGTLRGLDVDLSAAFAADLGVRLTYVDSSFPTLVADLLEDRCDVAMFGVAMLPARQEKLRFARPYLASDIYAVTTRANRVVRQWEDIDQPDRAPHRVGWSGARGKEDLQPRQPPNAGPRVGRSA